MKDYNELFEELEGEKKDLKKIISFLEKMLLTSNEWKGALVGGVSLFKDLSSLRETHLKMIQEQLKIKKLLEEREIKELEEYIKKIEEM